MTGSPLSQPLPTAASTSSTPAAVLSSIEQFLAPIPGDNPCGEDKRHDHAFMVADSEAKKLGGLVDQKIDWELIQEQCTALLASQTKDLKLAGCWTLASFKLEGLGGAVRGLALVVELLERYWAEVYPLPRSPTNFKRRASPLSWLNLQLTKQLRIYKPSASDSADLIALHELVLRYRTVCQTGFSQQAPAMAELVEATEQLLSSTDENPVVDPPPEPEPTPEVQDPQSSALDPLDKAKPASSDSHEPTSSQSDAQSSPAQQRLSDLEQLIAPIPGKNPCGADKRYDEAFQSANNEAKKLDDQLRAHTPDWELVADSSESLLASSTKDLNLSAFLTLAYHETRGLDGIIQGVLLTCELLDRYWEQLYPLPRRESFKRRASPLSWLNRHLEKRLANHVVAAQDAALIAELAELLSHYSQLCSSRFGFDAPATRNLIEQADALSIKLGDLHAPEPEPEPEPVQEATPPTPAPAAPAEKQPKASAPSPDPAPTLSIEPPQLTEAPLDLEDTTSYLSKLGDNLCSLAAQLRQADPKSPLAYRLNRQGLWFHLSAAPPVISGSKTGIPAPSDFARKQLQTLIDHQNWSALLDEAESMLGKSMFCLDLHRYVVQALEGMGGGQEAIAAVKAELAAILTRMPKLLELHFSNNTPLADQDTLQWIQRSILGGSSSTEDSENEDQQDWLSPVQTAIEAGDRDLVVALMDQALHSALDRIQYVRRALAGSERVGFISGLPLLLVQLAQQQLSSPDGGLPLDRQLETKCLQTLIRLRSSPRPNKNATQPAPETHHLVLQLGQRSLKEALPYL